MSNYQDKKIIDYIINNNSSSNSSNIISDIDINSTSIANGDLDPLEHIKDRGARIMIENGFFVCFEIFLLCLCVDAVSE